MKFMIFIAVFQYSLSGMDITSCNLSAKKDSGDFIYAKAIKVSGISFKEGKVLMPVEENRGKTYENIKLVSRRSYENLVSLFSKGSCDNNTRISDVPFKVRYVKKLKSPYRIANVEIEFDETIIVVFGLMKGKDGKLWVSIPENLEFLDKNLQEKVEREIIKHVGQIK